MSPSDIKKKTVEDFTKLLDEYPVIAAVNMKNLPAKQLQKMVSSLRDTMLIKMTKRRLMKLALEKSKKKNIKELEKYLSGMPAIMFSKENPFKLYNILEKSKSTAPAKAGQKAPKDLVVPAGPTSFAPGPIIGELGAAGIKAGIENGKVVIKKDSVVAKEGDIISQELAGVLIRLGVEPMEIGLDIVAIYEDGSIFTKDVLAIDESKYLADVQYAARSVFNLSLEIGYVSKDNIQHLISKAYNDSKNLALSQDLITDLTVGNLVGKAESQMKNLSNKLNLPDKEDKKMEEPGEQEEVKKETIEEKKEEVPKEKKAEEKAGEVKEEKKPEKNKEEKEEEPKEKPSEEVSEEKEEKTLEQASENDIQTNTNVTEEDMKKAEENLKKIQENIQKSK